MTHRIPSYWKRRRNIRTEVATVVQELECCSYDTVENFTVDHATMTTHDEERVFVDGANSRSAATHVFHDINVLDNVCEGYSSGSDCDQELDNDVGFSCS